MPPGPEFLYGNGGQAPTGGPTSHKVDYAKSVVGSVVVCPVSGSLSPSAEDSYPSAPRASVGWMLSARRTGTTHATVHTATKPIT